MPAFGQGEADLTAATYAQNFDALGTNAAATLPSGFKMTQKNITSPQFAQWTNASNFGTTTLAASNGTPTTGGRSTGGATGGTARASAPAAALQRQHRGR